MGGGGGGEVGGERQRETETPVMKTIAERIYCPGNLVSFAEKRVSLHVFGSCCGKLEFHFPDTKLKQ